MNKSKYALDHASGMRLKARTEARRGFARGGVMLCLALLGLGVLCGGGVVAALAASSPAAGAAMAAGPLFGMVPRLCKEADDDDFGGGGSGKMTDEQFQRKVLENVRKVREAHEELTAKYDNLDKDTKEKFEDLTKAKEKFDGLDSQIADFQKAMARVEKQLAREKRMAFGGDPIQRILSDEKKRAFWNAIARHYTSKHTGVRLAQDHQDVLDEWHQYEADVKAGKFATGKALGEGSGLGANWIHSELLPDIYDLLAQHGTIWPGLDVVPASTATTELLVDTADPLCVFVDENAAGSEDSTMAGTTVSAAVKKAMTLLYVSEELLADSRVDVSARLLRKFRNAANYRMDWIAATADGGADGVDGGFEGFFEAGTAAVAASGNVSVATLDFEDVTATMLAANSTVMERTPRWWLHPQQLVRMLSIKDGNGRPIFLTATEAPSPGGMGSILGAPVTLSQVCPSADGTSKPIAAYGDPMAMAVLLRQDFTFAVSNDFRFANAQVAFRALIRCAAKIRLATGISVLTTAAS